MLGMAGMIDTLRGVGERLLSMGYSTPFVSLGSTFMVRLKSLTIYYSFIKSPATMVPLTCVTNPVTMTALTLRL